MKTEVVVIGGGLAGLGTAALLSKKGYKVRVFEAAAELGGRAAVTRRGQYKIDFGIHLHRFGNEGKAAQLFRMLGTKLELLKIEHPLLYINGEYHLLPKGAWGILKTKFLSLDSRFAMLKLMKRFINADPKRFINTSVFQLVKEFKKQSNILDLISVYSGAGITFPDIERASAREFLAFLQKAVKVEETAAYPKGGWQQVITKLASIITAGGGELYTHSRVEQILVHNGLVSGVQVRGETVGSAATVFAADIRVLFSLIDEKLFPEDFRHFVRSCEPVAGISLDFGLNKKLSTHKTLIFTARPVTMGMFVSNLDSGLAPAGKQLCHWFYPLPHKILLDKETAEIELQRLRRLVYMLYPNIRKYIDWERPMMLEVVDGCAPIIGQEREKRPEFRAPIRGLFFAGDWTRGEGWGGDIAFDSAMRCAKVVEEYLST